MKILFLIIAALGLSACSPEKLFELVAKSDIEQASSDSVAQSNQVIANFDTIINMKKTQYPQFSKLESVSAGDISFGYVFAKNLPDNKKFILEAYAVLPPLEQDFYHYEAWLKDTKSGSLVSVGQMLFNQDSNSRSVVFTGNGEVSVYQKIIITEERDQDDNPGTYILEGEIKN